MRVTSRRSTAGFTLAELVTVIAIIAVLAGTALPVVRFALRRQREIQLRDRLQRITMAIDRYAELRQKGLIKSMAALGSEGYPKELEELTQPVELIDGKKLVLLRERDLVDPMTGRAEWLTRSTTDELDAVTSDETNVFDIHSTSTALSLDGKTRYSEW
jgi:general secretion pathway protein G